MLILILYEKSDTYLIGLFRVNALIPIVTGDTINIALNTDSFAMAYLELDIYFKFMGIGKGSRSDSTTP